jgi:hypothetical protein
MNRVEELKQQITEPELQARMRTMVKRLADMSDEELMGTNSVNRIKHLKTRLRNAKKEKTRRSVEAALARIKKLQAKQARSVKAVEARVAIRKEKSAYANAEKARLRSINADLRAGVRKERLLAKHFTDRKSFRHMVTTMQDAKPKKLYRFHISLQAFVKLDRAVLRLGAPIERDFRRASHHMNDCEIFLNNEWVTIPIRGIDGERAYVPVAPVEPPVVEDAQPELVPDNGPITFTQRTTYAELMSGRVIVASLHDRCVLPYTHDYSVQKLEHDGRFYVAHLGTWELIPGQPAPPSPPQKPPDISYGWQGDEVEIETALAQWTPPEPPAPSPEPEPISWERIHELRKRLAELNGKES